ncbi:hypothetical protein OIU77_027439 [Salix suchowensis]|uniref:SUF system FeS cluster assembly SufBD core domain-containing protein n=1 Tax=Salix suchowensis TaxID=1278906 RepID=A0ABQ9BPR4_9ROSI|nr:hypothetical protein OIU77_027439 [Salix suchowensis]
MMGDRFAFEEKLARDAQQKDAGQLTRSLLLEPRGTVNVKPNLQIIADDVKCSHGAARLSQPRPGPKPTFWESHIVPSTTSAQVFNALSKTHNRVRRKERWLASPLTGTGTAFGLSCYHTSG